MGRVVSARSSLLKLTVALMAVGGLAAVAIAGHSGTAPSTIRPVSAQTSQRGHVLSAYAQLPLSFEPNQGQTDGRVKFISRRSNFTIFLTGDGATLSMHHATPGLGGVGTSLNAPGALRYIANQKSGPSDNVSFKFKGANPDAKVSGADKLQTVTNYLIGRDPSRWHSSIPNYTRVKYESIYPGVDLVFYGNYGRLEYDIDVAPGVDPRVVQMEFDDAQGLRLGRDGELLLHAGKDEVALGRPIAYQETNGARRPVEAKYVLNGSSGVRIAVGDYDRGKALIIDPAIMYSTYLGGTVAQAQAIAVDATGEAFISGWTCCVNDFPTANAYQDGLTGIDNAFVAKFSADGKTLIYSTYLGGSKIDVSTAIGVDSKGDAFVTGLTNSTDFPTTPSGGTALAGGFDAFVAELNPTGNGLVYSRYLGGAKDDVASGIAVDANGLAYVSGQTFSVDFPTTSSAYQQDNPNGGAVSTGFLARVDPPASAGSDAQVYYATYLGGPSPHGNALLTGAAIAGPSGNVYIVGGGGSAVPVTTGRVFGGTFDAVVGEFNTNGSGPASLLFSEFIGGSGFDSGTGIATQLGCASNCPAFISGYTFSSDLNVIGARSVMAGLEDGFIAEVDPHGGVNHVNYVGGKGFDEATAAAVDSKGNELVAGVSFNSASLPGPFTETLQPPPSALGQLFTSSNGGTSFAPSSWPAATAGSVSFGGLAIDKSVSPAIMYLGTNQNGLWKSIDGGVTFRQLAFPGVQIPAVGVETGIGKGPKAVFAAESGIIALSADAGKTFIKLAAVPHAGPVNYYYLGSEEPTTAGTGSNFFVFAGSDQGLFVSTNLGVSFTAATGLATGKQKTQVFTGVRDTTTGAYYVGTDKGVFKSTNDGAAFTPTNLNTLAVISLAVDASTTPSTLYAGTYGGGVVASSDGFNANFTFAQTAPAGNLNYVAVDDATSPAIVYAGAGDNQAVGTIWRSTNQGHTYTQLDPANFNLPCCIFPIGVNFGEIFAGNYLEADGFIAKVLPSGVAVSASSPLGGGNHDRASGIAVDTADNAYVDGLTYSSDYPVLNPEQAGLGGGGSGAVNAFVTKVGYTTTAKLKFTSVITFPTQTLRTSSNPKTATLTNTSKTDTIALGYLRITGNFADDFQITSGVVPLATSKSKVAATQPCGSTLAPKAKCTISVVFTPLAAGSARAGLVIPSNAANGTQIVLLQGKSKRLH